MLYFAYGSNLNKRQMARRCPAARPIGKFTLHNARLVFRGVADCVFSEGDQCPGALWRITPECERELDRYEGVSGGMYRREFVEISGAPNDTHFLIYRMNRDTGIWPPSLDYYDTIERGYRDFGMSIEPLLKALKEAETNKAPTYLERQRYRRDGRPPLARHSDVLRRAEDLFGPEAQPPCRPKATS